MILHRNRLALFTNFLWYQITLGLFTFHGASKALALSTSGYTAVCQLSERITKLQFYEDGTIVQVGTNDEDADAIYNSNPNEIDENRTLYSHQRSKSPTSYLSHLENISTRPRREINTEESKKNDNVSFETKIAKECICGSQYHRKSTYCLVHNKENYCQVPTSKDDPIECFHSSMFMVFIRNLWPLSLLWLMALTFYLISTEAGRSTIKHMCSKLCCCFGGACCNNSRMIENIISREVTIRDLYQIASLTREQGYVDQMNSNSTMVTYILKTKEYFGGNGNKKTTSDLDDGVELSKQHYGADDDDILESPSNETMLTSPDSFASSPSFDDGTPMAEQSNERHQNHDGNNICQQQSYASPTTNHQLSAINESYDEDEEENLCTICMVEIEDGDRVGVLSCDHLYHADCLKEWIKRRNVCPLCQVQIAEEKPDPNGGNTAPRVRYPTTFTVRTTGSPNDAFRRRPRVRRNRAATRLSDLNDDDTTRRQLFVVNGNNSRVPSVTSRAGVTLISTRMGPGQNQQQRVLVGNVARTPSSRFHAERNVVVPERRQMRLTTLTRSRNNQS